MWLYKRCPDNLSKINFLKTVYNEFPEDYKIIFKPKISVIIPIYNNGKFLKDCVDSVINQSLVQLEIICVNDGSTDNTAEILSEYTQKDFRIKVITQTNHGQSYSRNKALKLAIGDYVLFVDSDDMIAIETCEKLYDRAYRDNLDMLGFTGYNFIDNPNNKIENKYYSYDDFIPHLNGKKVFMYKDVKPYLYKLILSSCLTCYRLEFIKKHQLTFPLNLHFEDNLFYVKALTKAQRIGIDPAQYYKRRIHPDSITQNWSKYFGDYIIISDLVLTYLKDYKVDTDIFDDYKKRYISKIVLPNTKLSLPKSQKNIAQIL